MNITNVQNFKYNYHKSYKNNNISKNNYNQCSQPTFNGKSNKIFEKGLRNIEFLGRKIINKISNTINQKHVNSMYNGIKDVKTNSSEYIEKICQIGRFFSKGKEVEINLESNRLNKIAQSNKPHIFIMNHDNQSKDPEMLSIFNTLLNEIYLSLNKGESCPRPKIIMNEDILLSMDKKMRTIFEKLGAIGVEASICSDGGIKNAKKLVPILKDFAKEKVNIFIFPEGKLAAFKSLNLEDKFQAGVGEMVYRLSQKMETVNVVPLSFAYNKKSKPLLSSINIGETVVFKKDGENILSSKGNISSDFAKESYKKFFNKPSDFIKITDKGVPVNGKDNGNYIAGILCENLRINTIQAKNNLPKESLGDKVITC